MTKRVRLVLFVIIIGITLAACGQSVEDEVVGDWKLEQEGEIEVFLDITEDNLTYRFPLETDSQTVDYQVTETTNDHFMIEVSEPGTSQNELLFEGYFDGEDKITVVEVESGKIEHVELVRVDSIFEEQDKLTKAEEKRQEEREREKELARQEAEEAEPTGEEVYMNRCAQCHGGDLSGESGPSLDNLSDKYSASEIETIVFDGIGAMPPQNLSQEEIEVLAEWLLEEN